MRLELEDVHRTYSGGSVKALRGATARFAPGELVAITGPSGSGKSTMLNILGLLDGPDSGRCLIDGCDVSTLTERELDDLRGRRFGFVFQASYLLPNRTVLANVGLGLRMAGQPAAVADERSFAALESVGLAHRCHAAAASLSGGERQRAGFARAFVGEPDAVLADEPTGNLDRRNTDIVLDLLRQTTDAQRVVIVVTHDPEVARVADRVLDIVDGRVQ